MRKVVCDKCGRDDLPTANHEPTVNIEFGNGAEINLDLCKDCCNRLRAWAQEPDPQVAAA